MRVLEDANWEEMATLDHAKRSIMPTPAARHEAYGELVSLQYMSLTHTLRRLLSISFNADRMARAESLDRRDGRARHCSM